MDTIIKELWCIEVNIGHLTKETDTWVICAFAMLEN